MSPEFTNISTSTVSLTGVFLLSLAGSVHCAGMCGGFVTLFGGRTASPFSAHGAYHLGRLITYVALGCLAGSLGAGLDSSGALVGLQRGAALLTALLFVLWGAFMVADRRGSRGPRATALVPGPGRGSQGPFGGRVFRLFRLVLGPGVSPVRQAFSLGLLSGALPCGWLWGFLLLAAGTGSPWSGAALMGAFWAGTVPALLGVGVVTRSVARLGFLRGRTVTGFALVLAGLFALFVHTRPLVAGAERGPGGPTGEVHSCH